MTPEPTKRAQLTTHCLLPIGPGTTPTELRVMAWLAAGDGLLWIPIYEVNESLDGDLHALAAIKQFGGPRPIRDVSDLFSLPLGIKGWLLPPHLDDTEVICARTAAQEATFATLAHPITGERITYRTDTANTVPELDAPGRTDAATERAV